MKSLTLYIIATFIIYVGFYVIDYLGGRHWAFYPTIFVTVTSALFNLLGALAQLRNKKNEK